MGMYRTLGISLSVVSSPCYDATSLSKQQNIATLPYFLEVTSPSPVSSAGGISKRSFKILASKSYIMPCRCCRASYKDVD